MTKIVNIRKEKYDIYIGRPSKWGNPFSMKDRSEAERIRVIEKYAVWIKTQAELLACLPELKDKTLGCFCTPLACHGNILAKLADEQEVV